MVDDNTKKKLRKLIMSKFYVLLFQFFVIIATKSLLTSINLVVCNLCCCGQYSKATFTTRLA